MAAAEVSEAGRAAALVEARAQQAHLRDHTRAHERAQPAHGAAQWGRLQPESGADDGCQKSWHLHMPQDRSCPASLPDTGAAVIGFFSFMYSVLSCSTLQYAHCTLKMLSAFLMSLSCISAGVSCDVNDLRRAYIS